MGSKELGIREGKESLKSEPLKSGLDYATRSSANTSAKQFDQMLGGDGKYQEGRQQALDEAKAKRP